MLKLINDYHFVNGTILRPLGLIPGSKTHFDIDPDYGDWTLDGETYHLDLHDLLPLLTEDNGFHVIKLDDIAWQGFNLDMSSRAENCRCCNGDRFRDCDATVPGILLDGINNPEGRRYRCLDGKHRIEALLTYDQIYANFYVLTLNQIKEYLYT